MSTNPPDNIEMNTDSKSAQVKQTPANSFMQLVDDLNGLTNIVLPNSENKNSVTMSSSFKETPKVSNAPFKLLPAFSNILANVSQSQLKYNPKDSPIEINGNSSVSHHSEKSDDADMISVNDHQEANYEDADDECGIIPNNKLTFSFLDDTIIFCIVQRAAEKIASYKLVAKLLGKSIPTIQRRYADLKRLQSHYMNMIIDFGTTDYHKAKNFGVMFERKTGEPLQSVRLASFNKSSLRPSLMPLIMECNFSYQQIQSRLFEGGKQMEPEILGGSPNRQNSHRKRIKKRKAKYSLTPVKANHSFNKSSSNLAEPIQFEPMHPEIIPASRFIRETVIKKPTTVSFEIAYDRLKSSFIELTRNWVSCEELLEILGEQFTKNFKDSFEDALAEARANLDKRHVIF